MISRNSAPLSLKSLAPVLFLLLCCSICEFAPSPSKAQEPRHKRLGVEFKFLDTPVKPAIEMTGEGIGLKVVFDESVKGDEVIYMGGETATGEQALMAILAAKSLQARIIEENKIIVFRDNEANCQKYGQYKPWPARPCGNR